MFGAGIDEEFLDHGVAEFGFWQHAFDRDFDEAFWPAGADLSSGEFFQTPRVTGVVLIDLYVFLIAGESDFVGVDHDDIVAGVDVWGIFRVVFATEDGRDAGADTAEGFSVSVDDEPLTVDFLILDGPGFIT